jgi:hypothetical protein
LTAPLLCSPQCVPGLLSLLLSSIKLSGSVRLSSDVGVVRSYPCLLAVSVCSGVEHVSRLMLAIRGDIVSCLLEVVATHRPISAVSIQTFDALCGGFLARIEVETLALAGTRQHWPAASARWLHFSNFSFVSSVQGSLPSPATVESVVDIVLLGALGSVRG